MIQVERTDYVSVPVTDLEQAKSFYGETLGIPRNHQAHESHPEFETGNVTISLLATSGDSTPSIALRVPDVAAARERLEDAGVQFDGEVFDTGVCHVAFFEDPGGNRLALHRRYAPYPDGSMP